MGLSNTEHHARVVLRQRALEWASGLTTARGRDRGRSIAGCGRPIAGLFMGAAVAVPYRCRDRCCPRCQAERSEDLSVRLRTWVGRRLEAGGRIFAVTLTQPKPVGRAKLKGAMDSVLAAWRWRTNSKEPGGPSWRALTVGAVRSLEVTWSPRGAGRPHGGTVRYDGWHAHLHLLVELRSSTTVAELETLIAEWYGHVDGDMRASSCEEILAGDDRRVGEVTKYVAKPLSVKMDRSLGRQLATCVHGRRMLVGVGEWLSWRRLGGEGLPSKPPVLLAVADDDSHRKPVTIHELLKSYGGGSVPEKLGQAGEDFRTEMGRTAYVLFVGWQDGEKIQETRTVAEVIESDWAWLEEAGPDPPKAEGARDNEKQNNDSTGSVDGGNGGIHQHDNG